MKPWLGDMVVYRLTRSDAEKINRRRTDGDSIADRIKRKVHVQGARVGDEGYQPYWPVGAQAHIGAPVEEGQSFPMMVVKTNGTSTVNGQVFLDGNDVYWVQIVDNGPKPGQWYWPDRD